MCSVEIFVFLLLFPHPVKTETHQVGRGTAMMFWPRTLEESDPLGFGSGLAWTRRGLLAVNSLVSPYGIAKACQTVETGIGIDIVIFGT